MDDADIAPSVTDMAPPMKILIVEDSPADFLLIERCLRHEGMEAECLRVESMPELESALAAHPWDVVLADYALPGMEFEQVLTFVRSHRPNPPVILVTGTLGEEKAVDLLKQGCSDVVLKQNLSRLGPAIARSQRDSAERNARQRAEHALARSNRALRMTLMVNQALVRADSEEDLLRVATRVMVEYGDYSLVTISYRADDPEKSIVLMASAGKTCCGPGGCLTPSHHAAAHPASWADTEEGQTPIAQTLRTGATQICPDIAAYSGCKIWRDIALACGFASIIVLPLPGENRTIGGLSLYAPEPGAFDEDEAALFEELANDLAYGVHALRKRAEFDRLTGEHRRASAALRQALEQTIQTIADTCEARDRYTAGHQRRVTKLAIAIAQEMRLPEETIQGLRLASSIHDLGKINLPSEILSKPGELTDIELLFIKTHPQAGYDILKQVEFPWPVAEIIWQHHERLDGSGYPRGLVGKDILLEARILMVADVVEAMSSHRPYRAGLGMEAALSDIKRGQGSLYDANVVAACLKVITQGMFAF
jgi:response regulator RpfG family c-di-GMP phosphodiesterase